MNIGYVKLDKLNKFQEIYRNLFKIIKKKNNCYYIPSKAEKILRALERKLIVDKVDYIIQEKDINCNYKELNGKYILKYMLPEIMEYCFKILGREIRLEEVHICVEEFSKDNIKMIEEICEKVKVVNIVTNNMRQFVELEKRLERREIYITVSSNKRKSLKRANLIVNIDFENFKGFTLNRNSIIINENENLVLGKAFEGICIERAVVDTNKIMRIFSEMENMNKFQLIEAEIIKKGEYLESRELIKNNKIKIIKVLGKRNEISIAEFNQIKRKMLENEKIVAIHR